METTEETIIRQRKKELQNDMEDKLSDIEENEKKDESKKEVKADFRYYYNKFRYYHYYIAKELDNYISVFLLWFLQLQLYLMSYRYNEPPLIPDDNE